MNLRDELDQFLAAKSGIEHIVYGDLTTGMVLYANATGSCQQEDHDQLLQQGVKALRAVWDFGNEAVRQILVSNGREITLFVAGSGDSDEGLCFVLNSAVGAAETADAAYETLARFATASRNQ